MKKEQKDHLTQINTLLRYWIIDMTTTAGSGHPTSSLSAVELMSTLLFGGIFRCDVQDPHHKNNDRLIFSKGHASPLYYALWAVARGINAGDLSSYRSFNSNLEGHPTMNFPFTEAPTGSLGQGLSIGVGMAIAQKKLDRTHARTYVLLGDSEMAEGQVWEAMQIAAHYELGNLVAIVDVNRLGQRGETMYGHDVTAYTKRAQAFGWRTVTVHGHDIDEIYRVYDHVIADGKKPLMIIAKTFKGRGISFLEDKFSWHGKVLSQEEQMEAIRELGHVDFDVRGVITSPTHVQKKKDNDGDATSVSRVEEFVIDPQKRYASRDIYGHALIEIMERDRSVVVLDAEVSNSTCTEVVKDVFPDRFFEMYIAEQNMVSVAVGLARCGYHPYVSTFAAFFTRAHDQIRMAQYSDTSITFVGSHAGVSIGADGGSQMGLEDIAMMRCFLGSVIFCPSDIVSARQHILRAHHTKGISYIRTTREKTPVLHVINSDAIDDVAVLRSSGMVDHIAVVSMGMTTHEALKAYEMAHHARMNIRVIDLLTIKPFNVEKFLQAIDGIKNIIIVEDHFREGGVGESVIAALREHDLHIVHLAVDRVPHSGTPQELLSYEKIDVHAIMNEVKKIYK